MCFPARPVSLVYPEGCQVKELCLSGEEQMPAGTQAGEPENCDSETKVSK